MPPHDLYVESHLGGGAVLRAKRPAKQNIGIDRDERVLESFRGFPDNFRFLCGDAIEVLEAIGPDSNALIYCDPPYLASTRRSRRSPYRYDLTDADHKRLLSYIRQLPCAVMVSGYPNALYGHVLADWNCATFTSPSRSGGRQEMLWTNFAVGSLLHDTRFLGDTFREREVFSRRRRRWRTQFARMPLAQRQAIITDLLEAFGTALTPAQHDLWRKIEQPASSTGFRPAPFCLDRFA